MVLSIVGSSLFAILFVVTGMWFLFSINDFAKTAKGKVFAGGIGIGLMFSAFGILSDNPVIDTICFAFIMLYLLVSAIKFHPFWNEAAFNDKMFSMIEFLKNIALIGVILVVLSGIIFV